VRVILDHVEVTRQGRREAPPAHRGTGRRVGSARVRWMPPPARERGGRQPARAVCTPSTEWTPTLLSPAAARTACHRSRRANRHPSSTPVARSSRSGSTSTAHCTVPRACQTCASPCARALTAPRCRGRVALRRPEHISYLLSGLGSLNSNYSSLDASRPRLAEPNQNPNPNPNPNPSA
jgi:hypothetical protein